MSKDMSTQYLLTLLSDRIKDMKEMVTKLKEQDREYTAWGDKTLEALKANLVWLKDKVDTRRDSLLKACGIDLT